jgi:pantoate--beta-alanine ligase
MQIIESLEDMKSSSQGFKDQGKTIASIATFGYFHAGHIPLIELAKANADIVVISKYYEKLRGGDRVTYRGRPRPRYIESAKNRQSLITEYMETAFTKDIEFCNLHGVDLFWNYTVNPDDVLSFKEAVCPNITSVIMSLTSGFRFPPMEGSSWDSASRRTPAHVWIQRLIVEKADVLVLGENFFHMNMVMGYSIKDLNLPIKVMTTPTVRDFDGLVEAADNSGLTKAERAKALSMPKTLKEISEWSSYPSVEEIKRYFISAIKNAGGQTWYVDVLDAKTGEILSVVDREAAVIVAVATKFGNVVYLSDNILISPK